MLGFECFSFLLAIFFYSLDAYGIINDYTFLAAVHNRTLPGWYNNLV